MADIPVTIEGRLMVAGGYSPAVMPYVQVDTTAFSQNLTIRSMALQNFINLILCVPGERIMDMSFGVGLKTYLFNMNSPGVRSTLRSSIISQTATYLPYIKINEIEATQPEDDPNLLRVEIVFTISTTGESLYLMVQDGRSTLLSSQLLTQDEAGRICTDPRTDMSEKLYIWDPEEADHTYQSCDEMRAEAMQMTMQKAATQSFGEPAFEAVFDDASIIGSLAARLGLSAGPI